MQTDKVVKIVKDKVRETIARETAEWNRVQAQLKIEREEQAKLNAPRRIGFRWDD
jgi:hypothetical protein